MGLFDLATLAQSVGYIGIGLIIFAESGLFFGFFLPGDTLLFTAGFLAAQDVFNIYILVSVIVIGAILGDSIGYYSGRRAGPFLFTRDDSFWFSRKRLEDVRHFFERHGAKSIVFARFIPFARTFTPIVAGAADMRYGTFLLYNVIGGTIWGFSLTTAGYLLGETAPQIDRYLMPAVVIGFIVFSGGVSLLPLAKRFIEQKYKK